jgi:hypothetical protein
MNVKWLAMCAALLLAGCGGGGGGDVGEVTSTVPPGNFRILATNDLGMHCMDREFSTFSILPPFNVVRAQVIQCTSGGYPRLLFPSEVEVTYEAVADAHGSVNSRSVGKTDFWQHAGALFGTTLSPGRGLTGLYMPADAPNPGPQPFTWKASDQLFEAFGIPITPIDDQGQTNTYPLLRIRARNPGTGATLATLDVVVPIASETDCRNCHLTGGMAANQSGVNWSTDPDPELQSKRNVLRLHDLREGTALEAHQPVLCASCHDSPPLELPASTTALAATAAAAPAASIPSASRVMHGFHGHLVDGMGSPVFPPNGDAQATCYQCHPGALTECQRGAMKTGGMECHACHGDMLAVGGSTPLAPGGSIDGQNDLQPRRPWKDMPRCSSCHTGDALNHLTAGGIVLAPDGIRLRQAYLDGDAAASAIASPNSRFAEEPNTLYRFSKGHGDVSCEGCHGSTHAEWPVADPASNDNVAAKQLQGHAGTIVECAVCHTPGTLGNTMNGPHGMHNVNQKSFIDGGHAHFYGQSAASCQACHGANLLGTALSRAAANRTWSIEGHTVNVAKGTPIGCTLCHGPPGSDD